VAGKIHIRGRILPSLLGQELRCLDVSVTSQIGADIMTRFGAFLMLDKKFVRLEEKADLPAKIA